ncbi:MAG: hypothetical protein K5656_00860 [Lachnospiraceae bacterium]|nr:hypothetical protein [Lachnospiraceae bacterium]
MLIKILITITLIVFISLIVMSIVKKIKFGSSCCGEHEAGIDSIKAKDSNPGHYNYHYSLIVDGMVCGNCVKRVENLFNKTGQMLAIVDLSKKYVSLHSMSELTRQDTAKMLDSAGYTLMKFSKEEI